MDARTSNPKSREDCSGVSSNPPHSSRIHRNCSPWNSSGAGTVVIPLDTHPESAVPTDPSKCHNSVNQLFNDKFGIE